jgi:hypothetical protein
MITSGGRGIDGGSCAKTAGELVTASAVASENAKAFVFIS